MDNFVLTDYLGRNRSSLPGVGFHEDRYPLDLDSSLLMARSRRWVVEDVRGGVRRQPDL